MTFQSIISLIFIAYTALAPLLFFATPKRFRPYAMGVLGIIFYYIAAGPFLLLIVGEVVFVYFLARINRRKMVCLALGVLAPLSILVYYKESYFLLVSTYGLRPLFEILNKPYMLQDSVLLPLGLSFFTFLLIHYSIEYRKGALQRHNFVDFVAFVMFFPTMAAGPLRRFRDFNRELHAAAFSVNNVFAGSLRIVLGFFKKIVVADSLAVFAGSFQSYSSAAAATPADLWISILAYSFMLYFDFSALADIAIGSSRLFGIRVPENFNNPYLKRNIALFWRSWHITLTTWLMDYVYKPLGGSRTTMIKTIRNVFVVFVLVGLWHGATSNFVAWGLYNGMLISVYRLYVVHVQAGLRTRRFYSTTGMAVLSVVATFLLVTIGWVFFASQTVDTSLFVLKKILLFGA